MSRNYRLVQSGGPDQVSGLVSIQIAPTSRNVVIFHIPRNRINDELKVRPGGALYHLWAEPPIHPILKVCTYQGPISTFSLEVYS